MITASSSGPSGPERRRGTMAEKRIKPKAAEEGNKESKAKTAAAGVQKKSLHLASMKQRRKR
jgi:hypothetical protein